MIDIPVLILVGAHEGPRASVFRTQRGLASENKCRHFVLLPNAQIMLAIVIGATKAATEPQSDYPLSTSR
jgi:hypothetical protein